MKAYHLNPTTGKVALCKARKACRFGLALEDHYATREEAQRAFEGGQRDPLGTLRRERSTPLSSGSPSPWTATSSPYVRVVEGGIGYPFACPSCGTEDIEDFDSLGGPRVLCSCRPGAVSS